jgi:arabinose-5-phosphate isomerase
MDLAAHPRAERGIDHAMAGERRLAAEGLADDGRLEMHAVVALHADMRAGQALLDQLADAFWIHGPAAVEPRKLEPFSLAESPGSMPFEHATTKPSDADPVDLAASGRRVIEIEIEGLRAIASRIDGAFSAACRLLLACQGRVVCIGMGKSGHVARKIAATFASTGTPSFYVHPGEAGHGDLGMITDTDVVLALSNSGETEELLVLLPVLKRQGNQVVAMTGRPSSTLATVADVHLDVSVPAEACPLALAPTASTTGALALGDALAVALLEARGFTASDFARSHPAGALGRRLLLHITDVMHGGDEVPSVRADVSVSAALVEMSRKRLGMTAVVDETGHLLGLYTDGDLRRTLDDAAIDLRRTRIDAVMTRQPRTIGTEALAVEAAQMMEAHQINALLVVDGANRLVGALNIHDLLRARVV